MPFRPLLTAAIVLSSTFKQQIPRVKHSVRAMSKLHQKFPMSSFKRARELKEINPVFHVVAKEIQKRSKNDVFLKSALINSLWSCSSCYINTEYSLKKERYEYKTLSNCPSAIKAVEICEYIADLIKHSDAATLSSKESEDLYDLLGCEIISLETSEKVKDICSAVPQKVS